MSLKLYMDVHVPAAVTEQLRRRGVDVLTAQDDEAAELEDDELLERSGMLGRLLFTQDIRFRALAEHWQQTGRTFAGLIFGHQLGGTIGFYVADLALIAGASDLSEWENVVEYIPFKRR